MSVNVFSSVESLLLRLSDTSALVRRRAVEVIGAMRLGDAVVGLAELCKENNEPSADVRAAAVWALGQIADSQTRDVVEAARSDSSPLVRNSAEIALRRL
jgi:HEAT repeat protein